MSISSSSVWEVRPSAGSDTNGGAYDFTIGGAGTDYSQQNAAQLAVVDAATSGAGVTTLTSAMGGFTAAMIGNALYLSGTNFTTGRYFITAFTNGNTVTLDRTPSPSGAGSVGTCNVGGALATWAELESTRGRVTGNTAYIKAGTYNLAIGITLSATGNNLPSASPDATIGYTTTRGDNGQVTITAAAAITMLTLTSLNTVIENFIFDGAGTANTGILNIASGSNTQRGLQINNVTVKACKTRGIDCNQNYIFLERCLITAMASGATDGVGGATNAPGIFASRCAFTNNPCPGVSFEGNNTGLVSYFDRCVFANNTGASSQGVNLSMALSHVQLSNCVFYKNGSDGVAVVTYAAVNIVNCILYGNGGYGLNLPASVMPNARLSLNFNAFGSNTSGARNHAVAGVNDVALTGDPFTNGGGTVTTLADVWANFKLNSTAGAGAACQGAGYP